MIKVGDKSINGLYIGDKKIIKVYLGDKLMYDSLYQLIINIPKGQYRSDEEIKTPCQISDEDLGKYLQTNYFKVLIDNNVYDNVELVDEGDGYFVTELTSSLSLGIELGISYEGYAVIYLDAASPFTYSTITVWIGPKK